VQEKKKTARREESTRDARATLRTAQRRVTDLETQIQELETRIGALTAELEDPELYTHADGVGRATKLGAELDQSKAALERALEQWSAASEELDALAAGQT
jgi:hypothetical protein